MANTSKHKINRTLTSVLHSSHSNKICTAREGLALLECDIINERFDKNDKEILEFNHIIEDGKNELLKNGITFVSKDCFHNPPSTKDALECASFFLDFKVTSKSDIKHIFGDDIFNQIDERLKITTFKDNLNTRSSDTVLLLNIALIYCTNRIYSITKDKFIPFFILKEKYQSLNNIQFNDDRSTFLFDVYNELCRIGVSDSPFSSNFVSLYRAYEYFIIPSNSLIQQIIVARKEYSRNTYKYNDKYVQNYKDHEKKIKKAQNKLLFYISNNIVHWLNVQDEELLISEYQYQKQDTLELLTDIMNEFKNSNRPPHSLSESFFATALLHMNSNEFIYYFINTVKSLFTIKDVFMLNELYKITFHILGKHHMQAISIDNNTIFNHIYNKALKDEAVISLADFIYGISEISNDEYLILETLLYSAINNPEEFQKIYGIILAYNPIPTNLSP